jgi:hypothetical protein
MQKSAEEIEDDCKKMVIRLLCAKIHFTAAHFISLLSTAMIEVASFLLQKSNMAFFVKAKAQ